MHACCGYMLLGCGIGVNCGTFELGWWRRSVRGQQMGFENTAPGLYFHSFIRMWNYGYSYQCKSYSFTFLQCDEMCFHIFTKYMSQTPVTIHFRMLLLCFKNLLFFFFKCLMIGCMLSHTHIQTNSLMPFPVILL